MSTFDGSEIEEVTIDGEEVQEITMDGDVVWVAEQLVDDYSVGSMDDRYWAEDPGQVEWPYPMSNTYGYGSDYHGWLHQDNSPNAVASLAPDNPDYSSSAQGGTVEGEYFGPGDIVEFYMRWNTFDHTRFMFNMSQYDTRGCIRLRFLNESGGYWRLESIPTSGSWNYYGGTSGGAPEDFVSLSAGTTYRIVIDMSSFPTIDCYLDVASSGSRLSSIGNTDSGTNWDDRGFGFWGNDVQETRWGPIRHIDADDI